MSTTRSARPVRRRRGDPLGDHRDHCAVVDRLDEQLSRLADFAHDQHSELERIRQAAEQDADRDEGDLR